MKTIKIILFVISSLCALLPEESFAQRVVRVRHPVVVRRAHVRYAALPRYGAVVKVRPATAVVVTGRRRPYYFADGVYYAQRRGAYTVVRPAPGLHIRVLPVGYRTIVVGPRNYYYYYGTYYTKIDNLEEYAVVAPPEGAVVDALPDGYEVKVINNQEYYYSDGVYYAEVDAPEFEDGVGYEVVKP